MKLHSYTKGPKDHPPVFLLHGLLGSSRNLFRVAEAVGAAGFYCIAFDQRGHGHSEHSDRYSLALMADDVADLMDSYSIESAHLVGHSMGARVSLAAAAKFPSRVKSLLMLDAGVRVHPDALNDLQDIIGPLQDSYPSKAEAEKDFARHSLQMRQFLLANLRTQDGEQAWVFDLEGVRRSLLAEIQTDQSEAFSKLTCPVGILRGERSEHFKQAELEYMLSLNPRARAKLISNAEHWLHADNFDETSSSIIKFLKKGDFT